MAVHSDDCPVLNIVNLGPGLVPMLQALNVIHLPQSHCTSHHHTVLASCTPVPDWHEFMPPMQPAGSRASGNKD